LRDIAGFMLSAGSLFALVTAAIHHDAYYMGLAVLLRLQQADLSRD
jgi:hypothetical protein